MDEDESAATIIAVEQAWKAARQSQDRSAEGKALLQLSEARLALKEVDHALKEANLAVSIFQEIRDRVSEAAAQLCVCNSHLGRIALDAQKSRFPATTNTMGALRASKAAYKIYDELADTTGKERSSRALSNALVVSGVPANTVPRPEALVQTQDLAGAVRDCGGHYSPFHEGPQLKVRHKPVESAGPEKKSHFRMNFLQVERPDEGVLLLAHLGALQERQRCFEDQKIQCLSSINGCTKRSASVVPLFKATGSSPKRIQWSFMRPHQRV